jgi:hypothetical protein
MVVMPATGSYATLKEGVTVEIRVVEPTTLTSDDAPEGGGNAANTADLSRVEEGLVNKADCAPSPPFVGSN